MVHALDTTTEQPKVIVTDDGMVLDADTGEILDVRVPEDLLAVDTIHEGMAFWILEKMNRFASRVRWATDARTKADGEIQALQDKALAALENTPEMIELRAIQRNTDRVTTPAAKALEWFRSRFASDLEMYARSQLSGKERTWRSPYGQVALKKVPAKLRVANGPEALATAKAFFPDAIKKTEEFQISKLTKDQKAQLLENPFSALEMGFVVEEERDDVTISAAVEVA